VFVHLALIHVLQLASKAGASLSGEFVAKRVPVLYHRRRALLPIAHGVFHPTTCFFPLAQNIRSVFIDQKSIEIGNADVAANVLGCAAKVPSPSFSVSVLFRRQ